MKLAWLILLVCILVTSTASGDDIDPMDASAGDFLDTDLRQLEGLASDAYNEGEYEIAASYYLSYLSRSISDAGNIYNLACCYGLMGNAELAGVYLERAVRAGFDDYDHIARDPDFDAVRDSTAFTLVTERIADSAAEAEAGLGEEGLFSAVGGFPFRIRFPEDFDPEEPTPLLIGLHGLGDSPEGYLRLWEAFDLPDFIFAVPPALYPFSVGSEVGYSWFQWGDDPVEMLRLDSLAVDYVMSLIEELRGEYSISEVYLLGFSQGCGMTWMTGLSHPDEFAGLIGFGGWLNSSYLTPEILREAEGVRAFVSHGTADGSVEYTEAEITVATMQENGIDVTFVPFEGGHTLSRDVLLQVEEWMRE